MKNENFKDILWLVVAIILYFVSIGLNMYIEPTSPRTEPRYKNTLQRDINP